VLLGCWPDGLGTLGLDLVGGGTGGQQHAEWIGLTREVAELIFELVRLRRYPEKPSHLQAVFAWASVADALTVAELKGLAGRKPTLWELVCDGPAHLGSVTFVDDCETALSRDKLPAVFAEAERYWRGEPGASLSLWEWVLAPPVRVVRQVSEQELVA
jgi:hypothetical protein